MATPPSIAEEKIERVVTAWETLRPDKSFGGMTLTEFKAKIAPSQIARQHLAAIEDQRIQALGARTDADDESMIAVALVVNGVKGDPAEGDNSDLYKAMGYVKKSERKTGLTRKGRDLTP